MQHTTPLQPPVPLRLRGLALLAAITFTFLFVRSAGAQSITPDNNPFAYAPDSVHHGMAVLYVGHLAPTCYADTVFGAADPLTGDYLPRVIVWGRPVMPRLLSQSQRDSMTACMGGVPPGLSVPYTIVQYPAWSALHGAATFRRFNSNDTLADMMIALHGTTAAGNAQRDTLRTLVIFGQAALAMQPAIHLDAIPPFQSAPFFAMDYRPQMQAPGSRDLSGRKSYELAPVSLTVTAPDTTRHGTTPNGDLPVMRIYPNPANDAATLEAIRVPSGEYLVEVVATSGVVVLRSTVTAHTPASVLGTLDLSHLESGYYAVRVTDTGTPGGRLVGTYPVVVTR
ncbi:MAG: T9SS type A sorting domain-containing protein [Bacteroidetes bacterium]|nr:T9SS type A sorting domain-containing protein [Bacteroidota bacterium]